MRCRLLLFVLSSGLAGPAPGALAAEHTPPAVHPATVASPGRLQPAGLRCEYLVDPLAIDTLAPRLSWRVTSTHRGQVQTAYRLLVASHDALLAQDRGDLWDSGKVVSDATTQIAYAGTALASRQRCVWKVQVWDKDDRPSDWSTPASWGMGLLRPEDWQAQWISFRDPAPLPTNRTELVLPPARYYRKEFTASRPVRRALVHATALGLYELEVNGRAPADVFFAPGWTDYRQRVYYQTYDVTPFLRAGANAIGVTVAEGWYAGYVGYGLLVGYGPHQTGRNIYGKTPALRLQLELEYSDGSREVVGTDPTWQTTDETPFREADLLMGETYDARREQPGWATPGFDARAWTNAIRAEANGSVKAPFHDSGGVRTQEFGFIAPAKLEAYPAPPVRVTAQFTPVFMMTPTNGVHVFNLGQNFAGTVRLRVKGPAGTKVQLRYGEMLHPGYRLMTENLRKARATDTYILRGDPAGETWTPRFTFHGFQFVELTGYPGEPGLEAVTGLALHSDTPLTSAFACSDPVVNRLFQNIVWTQRANFLELPTDCPQRDEREGWMGDAQVYVRTATYNADVAAFFTKWLREVEEAQLPSGAYPDYCPWPFQHGKAFAPGWTDAGIICPWTIWRVYGDTRLLERHWASMTRFMDWRQRTARDFLGIAHPDGNTWGDWLNLGEPTPIEYIDTVYFAYTTRLMSEMARALGKAAEADAYARLEAQIQAAFARKYLRPDGTLTVDTQTAYALALFVGLVPEAQRPAAGARLAAKIRAHDTRMATGFLGTRPLLPVLSGVGQHDLATRLLQSRKFPSWGFEVEQGATTVWERWDSFTLEHGFDGQDGKQNASMNSFSHYSFGAVGEWLFTTLAGIDTDGPGFRRLILRPSPPTPGSNPDQKPIEWVRAHYDSMHGRIASAWLRQTHRFEWRGTVPANTRATLFLPAASADGITEGQGPLARAEGVKFVRMEADRAVLELGSGSYQFVAPLPPPGGAPLSETQ